MKRKESNVSNNQPPLIYFDTNVYARPFDDQNRSTIQAEADSFLRLIEAVNSRHLRLLSSDILLFEVYNILNEDKRTKVLEYIKLCTQHIESSDDVLSLGKQVQQQCSTCSRDALHIASAMLGNARYFLSCDTTVTKMKKTKCYRRIGKSFRQAYFSVMNPTRFVGRFEKGELE
jgi:predicted nucleic acid-binding protein